MMRVRSAKTRGRVPKVEIKASYSPQVRARLKGIGAFLEKRVKALDACTATTKWDDYSNRGNEIMRSPAPPVDKIPDVWALADDVMSYAEGNVACRRGCCHCCHIGVAVPSVEAEAIGRRIGRTPVAAKQRADFRTFDFGYHNPCTFLQDGECSIYEHRPLMCRVHFSLDRDDLLCRLTPPNSNPVPLIDTHQLSLLLTLACGKDATLADIRDWFPRGGL